jgi:hypothetical protein
MEFHTWKWEIEGTAAKGQTWKCHGGLAGVRPGEFHSLPSKAMGSVLQALTNGNAVYGKPGVGCEGPYTVTRFLLERLENETVR